MRTAVVVSFVAATLIGSEPAVAGDPCRRPDFAGAEINVGRQKVSDPPIDNSKTVEELSALGEHRGRRALGITRAQNTYEMELEAQVLEVPSGGACAAPTRVDVRVATRDLQIFVAQRFEPGSCGYRRVLEHERRHVAINNDMIDEAAETIREALRDALEKDRVYRADDPQAAMRAIEDHLGGVVQQAFERARRRAEERQAAFDRKEAERGYFADGTC